ncbi:MAG: GerAB/ArcD/ProY family transporter [Clostridia bacterium]|nr:GerAB/ArcD/ProY family transporter [Clostridia bacterium]
MNQITIRQFACFCGFSLMFMKVLGLPSLMYEQNGNGGLITALILLLFDVLMIALAIALKKKFPTSSLYDLVAMGLGKVVAKIVFVFLAIVFFTNMSVLINETMTYMRDVVSEEITTAYVVFIFLPIVSCLVYNGLKNFARTAEFAFTFVIIGFVLCLALGEGAVTFSGLGPFFENGAKGLFSSAFNLSFFFSDFLMIFLLIDKVQIEKKQFRYVYFIVGLVALLLIVLYVAYFKLYTITASFHKNAIADVTQYRRIVGNVGNLDIIVILFVFFSTYIQGAMLFYSITQCYNHVLGYENKKHSLITINSAIVLNEYLVFYNIQKITFFVVNYMKYASFVYAVAIPIYLCCVLVFAKGGKRVGSNKKPVSQSRA